MKKLLILPALLLSTLTFSQSVTISHSGLAPSATITVQAGEEITFIHGGGGDHPMVEGWGSGETSTPNTFAPQTVTSSNPTTVFTIDVVGTYYYHCGTNSDNTNNWGKIIVTGEVNAVDENDKVYFDIYPNPASTNLTIQAFTGKAEIFNAVGTKIMDVEDSNVNIEKLATGTYFIKMDGKTVKFVKK